jgi:gamma-glutamyltranspeptidase / glutathione hydrolase
MILRRGFFALLALLACAPAWADPLPRHDMVEAADPRAAEIGREILRAGGSAVDAAAAIAIALTLVEPQSAGIGGGGFLVYWSAKEQRATSFDGRETAPAAARPDRFMGPDGKPLDFFAAVVGGRSIGVPGLLRMLALAQARYGKLPWSQLVMPTARLAAEGAAISPRLHAQLAADRYLANNAPARALYYAPDGTALAAGTMIVNLALAATLSDIADQGADAFYQGPIARDVVEAVRAASPPGDLGEADLADYRAKERPPVCGTYHEHRICGMGPPSSGAVTTIELLKLLEPFDLRRHVDDVEAWHLFAEASRLAYADRARYLADTDFVPAPVAGLIDPGYDTARAQLIDPARAHQGPVAPGDPPGRRADNWRDGRAPELPSTSTLSVIDGDGNAVALTASIENTFGARVMVRGFLLNNELTDFSFVPEEDGKPVANRVEPGKRPLSAMAPSLVFAPDGKLELVVGSAGGAPIIADVAKTILAVVDWHMDLPDALALTNISNRNGATEIEAGAQPLADALAARGHKMRVWKRESGLGGIRITKDGYEGAFDKRREGAALGD